MDVVVWLRGLGLGKYEAAFRKNEIDETVLPDLTAEDLKELGVTALGHRRKLLAAIAALREDASGKAPSVDTATASGAPGVLPEDRAERRQVTVMFSDLVGSTALSARMDPEDLIAGTDLGTVSDRSLTVIGTGINPGTVARMTLQPPIRGRFGPPGHSPKTER